LDDRVSRTLLAGISVLVAGVGCSSEAGDASPEGRARIPSVLAELLLARDSDEITPVVFPHAQHQDPTVTGRELDCAFCHHTLTDLPDQPPAACGTCHPHRAEEGTAPDI
jgi:hypothetical protein